jgi:hypothetical protein
MHWPWSWPYHGPMLEIYLLFFFHIHEKFSCLLADTPAVISERGQKQTRLCLVLLGSVLARPLPRYPYGVYATLRHQPRRVMESLANTPKTLYPLYECSSENYIGNRLLIHGCFSSRKRRPQTTVIEEAHLYEYGRWMLTPFRFQPETLDRDRRALAQA